MENIKRNKRQGISESEDVIGNTAKKSLTMSPLSFAQSLAYVDHPNVVFKHPRSSFYLSCTSDYVHASKLLEDKQSNVLPIYFPKYMLPDQEFNFEIIDSLTKKYLLYAKEKFFGKKYSSSSSNWIPAYTILPDISLERRLLGIKYLVFIFIFDDPLEELIGQGMLELVGAYIQNISNISTGTADVGLLLDLRKFVKNDESFRAVQLAELAQELLFELMIEFKTLLPPKVYKLFCQMNLEYYKFVLLEVKIWAKKLENNELASHEERISCKSVSSGLANLLCTTLEEEDVKFYPVVSHFWRLINISDQTNNDLFSYFKELTEVPANVLNVIRIYQDEGLSLIAAFRETTKARNELFRSIEVIINNMPKDEAKSLKKGLIILLASTHFYLVSSRYGWTSVNINSGSCNFKS